MNANAHLTTDPLHHDPDHTIDRALSALRDAAPRPGLEGRILTSLEHRATESGGLPFHKVKGWGIARGSARGNLSGSAHLALWAATSAALIAIASLLILHRHAPSAEIAKVSSPSGLAAGFSPLNTSSNSRGALAPAQLSTNAVILSEAPQGRSRRTPVFENCSDLHHQGCPIHDDARVGMGGVAQTPTDARALADLHAPSHPAPPLPLTPQERLFLHILRYGNATELAELNPLVRAQHDADETAAFKAFFPDPPPLEQPLGDTE